MKKIKIGYFADGPWSHQALDKLLADDTVQVGFVCARNDRPDPVLKIKAEEEHIDFITHPKIMDEWFKSVFKWLFKCEDKFGFDSLSGYEKRLYGYLAERYLSFWFNKYTNPIEWDWVFVDMNNGKRTNV